MTTRDDGVAYIYICKYMSFRPNLLEGGNIRDYIGTYSRAH